MSGISSLLPLDGYADARERPPPVPLLDEAHAALTELLDTLRAEYWQRHAVEMHCRRQFHLSPAQASTLMRACPNSVTLEVGRSGVRVRQPKHGQVFWLACWPCCRRQRMGKA